ncbi:Holliday junction resolvase RuvX [bacterium]|nr:Holliday junction resolvase RuvX [bacterium]
MGKIMGLDVGTKRIGVSLSDPMHIIAQPNCVIQRTSDDIAIQKIIEICNNNQVEKIVIGLPKNMNGTIGPQAQNCIDFADRLKDFDIIFEDERLTSHQAETILKDLNKKYTKDKGQVDIKSACIILQQYLDRR